MKEIKRADVTVTLNDGTSMMVKNALVTLMSQAGLFLAEDEDDRLIAIAWTNIKTVALVPKKITMVEGA